MIWVVFCLLIKLAFYIIIGQIHAIIDSFCVSSELAPIFFYSKF
ncbi:hypothetical protein [Moraxella lacunata]